MKRSWDLKPNLLECLLEDRIVPAGPLNNLGLIVQTTGGLVLVTPFPGAVNLAAMTGAGGSSNTAASVSGAAWPTGIYVTGTRGISAMMPGNFTGNPAVTIGGSVGSGGGTGLSIKVGSGADEDGGPVGAPAASRTNPAYNGATTGVMAYIGQVSSTSSSSESTGSGMGSQTQAQSAPVPALRPSGVAIPGSPAGTTPAASSPMNPSLGAPRLLRGLGTSLTPSLPGGFGVGSLSTAPSPGGY